MPHLSPLSWALASVIFWFSFMNMMSTVWWSQSPSTNLNTSKPTFSFNKWDWS